MSDLREALKPCPFCGGEARLLNGGPGNYFVQCTQCKCTTNDVQPERALELWNTRAALAQPEAVEPVPVSYVEVINGKVVSVRLDKSRHCTEPVYLTPPLAPDERMRRALERSAQGWANVLELDLLPKQHRETAEALRDEARSALSRADEGKECLREGTVISYESTNGVGKVLSANRPSDPTPPDATAQREAIARIAEKLDEWSRVYGLVVDSDRENFAKMRDELRDILALQTRAGG